MWKVCYDSLRFPRLFSFKSLEENRTYSRKHLQKFLPPQLVHQRYHFTCLLQLVPFTFRNIFFPFLLFSRVTTICLVKSCKLSEPTYLLSFHSTFWDILYAPRHLIVVFLSIYSWPRKSIYIPSSISNSNGGMQQLPDLCFYGYNPPRCRPCIRLQKWSTCVGGRRPN